MLTRAPPEAGKGKAAALNAAWRHLDTVLSSGRWAGWPRERVVVVVVDADGRLDPHAPEHVAPHFADPRVGGLQVLVRIYNRRRPLTWCQDVEFSVYGLLYQAGTNAVGHRRHGRQRPVQPARGARLRWPTPRSAGPGATGSPRTRISGSA